ncbi:MAG TPA: hypothetical protein VM140_14620 [Burkholderiales bacterium]|nr:hypothetical protein [Burkholderiales bacterium]
MIATLFALFMSADAVWGQATFSARIDFSAIERCSDRSPEIIVQGVPSGTHLFEVYLQDYDAPSYPHGGGKVANDGSGVIRAGAVKGNYDGPCPPFAHQYNFTITARDAKGKKLGETEVRGTYPAPRDNK